MADMPQNDNCHKTAENRNKTPGGHEGIAKEFVQSTFEQDLFCSIRSIPFYNG